MINKFSHNEAVVGSSKERALTGFLNQVYGWMTVGLILTGFTAWFASVNPAVIGLLYSVSPNGISLSGLSWILIIAQLGLVFALSGIITQLSGSTATLLFMLYAVLSGLTLTSIFIAYTYTSITAVFFITAGMFAATSFYGYVTKRDLSAFGRFLFMGLIGILIASLVNFFLKSEGVMWAITYIGVFVFAGLTAVDTQKLKDMGQTLSPSDTDRFRRYVILGALTLYLDFINLFIMLLRIFGDRR